MRGFTCIGLFQPKTPENIGSALRAAYAFQAAAVFVQGTRYRRSATDTGAAYRSLPLVPVPDLLEAIPFDCVPIAIEIVDGAKPLETFPHPPRALYIFGPEDGSLPDRIIARCRDAVRLPSRVCLNLGATVNVVLYDRAAKRGGFEPKGMSYGHRFTDSREGRMKTYRCKCGQTAAWSSMGGCPCSRCGKCGSNLALGPDDHRDPEPHNMVAQKVELETDTGTLRGELTRCVWCLKTLAELEGQPMVHRSIEEKEGER